VITEVNFDGLVGPTHNYAGLARGNLASAAHQGLTSDPRAAALEGLSKMRALLQLGLVQGLLPPQPRPNLPLLHRLGFTGPLADAIERATREAPRVLAAAYSASSMWTANAATVCPSSDSLDARVHFTPANLVSLLHRHQEAQDTTTTLQRLFADPTLFVVHDPLPAVSHFSDEGAANHTRLVGERGEAVHLFAWGKTHDPDAEVATPVVHPARQSLEASRAVARLHQLKVPSLFWQQSPLGIDAGAFHTDVLAVGNGRVFLLHEHAFVDHPALVDALKQRVSGLVTCLASAAELPTEDAVAGYPFNSQLVTLPNGKMRIIAPREAADIPSCANFLARVVAELDEVEGVTYLPVRQSMANGGGPACLRLRVPLTRAQLDAIRGRILVTEPFLDELEQFVRTRYRDRLTPSDLGDPQFALESLQVHADLLRLLRIG
jgi:succinylarginine dihydrolase